MARKNARQTGNSDVFVFDMKTKAVISQPQPCLDGIKEKVAAIREVVPGKSNNEIILVLQYYDNNVEQTIQAFLEDGAKEALNEWHYPSQKPNNKKKKKNNKSGKNKTEENEGNSASQTPVSEERNGTPVPCVPNGATHNGDLSMETVPPLVQPTAALFSAPSVDTIVSTVTILPSAEPLPQRATILSSAEPLPQRATILPSAEPLPQRATILPSAEPLPQKATVLSSAEPLPQRVAPAVRPTHIAIQSHHVDVPEVSPARSSGLNLIEPLPDSSVNIQLSNAEVTDNSQGARPKTSVKLPVRDIASTRDSYDNFKQIEKQEVYHNRKILSDTKLQENITKSETFPYKSSSSIPQHEPSKAPIKAVAPAVAVKATPASAQKDTPAHNAQMMNMNSQQYRKKPRNQRNRRSSQGDRQAKQDQPFPAKKTGSAQGQQASQAATTESGQARVAGQNKLVIERSTSVDPVLENKIYAIGLERTLKDLQRQTTSLQRLKLILDEEVDKAYKSITTVFEDIRDALNNREAELIFEMDKVRDQGRNVLKKRQTKASELRKRINQAPSMSDRDRAVLRADVKLFVGDRKTDEDLCQTTRFVCEGDHMLKSVASFGEIVGIKGSYREDRPSVVSLSSHEELGSPLTPLNMQYTPATTPSTPLSPLSDTFTNSGTMSQPSSASVANSSEKFIPPKQEHITVSEKPVKPIAPVPASQTTTLLTQPGPPSSSETGRRPNNRRRTRKSKRVPSDDLDQPASQGAGNGSRPRTANQRIDRPEGSYDHQSSQNKDVLHNGPQQAHHPRSNQGQRLSQSPGKQQRYRGQNPRFSRQPNGMSPENQPPRVMHGGVNIKEKADSSKDVHIAKNSPSEVKTESTESKVTEKKINGQGHLELQAKNGVKVNDDVEPKVNGINHASPSVTVTSDAQTTKKDSVKLQNHSPKRSVVSVKMGDEKTTPLAENALPQRQPRQRRDVKRAEVVINGKLDEEEDR